MVPGIQSVLVDIGVNNGVCLNIHGISPAIGLDSKGKVGVSFEIPIEPAKKPITSILIAECGVSCSTTGRVSSSTINYYIIESCVYRFCRRGNYSGAS